MRRTRPPLSAHRPDLLEEWDYERNGELDPATVTAGSGRKVWWRCAREPSHRWQARIYTRADRMTGCPLCAPTTHRPYRSHPTLDTNPSLAAQWHPTLNGPLRPHALTLGSKRRVWWLCPVGPCHEWETEVHVRALKGSGCPFCCGRAVTPETALSSTHPDVAAEWHRSRNGALGPHEVTAGAHYRAWWRCRLGHEWDVAVGVRVAKRTGCPRCALLRIKEANATRARDAREGAASTRSPGP